MISQTDKDILRDVGREYLLDIAFNSKTLKEKLTFKEHVELCNSIIELTYEEVIGLTITEDIKDFEGKFRKFLKYSFAAIAGGIIGGFIGTAPPIAMFVLYTYRKISDTCSRACFNRLPMSTERKICRYECQVNATRRVVRDLRSEITQCTNFANPEKCEKKLRAEYIKWSRRLQQQMVKLNKAKLGVEEKRRQKRQKELAKRARKLAASYSVPVKDLPNFISESEEIRHDLDFKDHLELHIASSFIEEEEQMVKPPKIDPKKEKWARQALYLGLWVLPIPFFNDVVNYIIKKHNFACIGKCMSQKKFSRSLCINQCSYLSAKYGVEMIKKQMPKCSKADKPVKCKKKLYDLLEDWKQREVEAKIKFEVSLKKELAQARMKR